MAEIEVDASEWIKALEDGKVLVKPYRPTYDGELCNLERKVEDTGSVGFSRASHMS